MNELNELGFDRREIAKIGCAAEWWYGTTGGIMDQYCIANGRAGHALLIDCRKLDHEYIKIPDDIEIVVFETTIRHKQIDSPFDLRKRQAKEVLEMAKLHFKDGKIEAIRDISLEMLEEIHPLILEKFGSDDGEMYYRRVKHPISENNRVLEMKDALKNYDYQRIGSLLYECHESLKNDYEVSCSELDSAVETGRTIRGIIGSRMIGGGFGGCTINLVKRGTAQHFAGEIEEKFRKKTGIKGNAYVCSASDGARKIV
jgi:galactokinase